MCSRSEGRQSATERIAVAVVHVAGKLGDTSLDASDSRFDCLGSMLAKFHKIGMLVLLTYSLPRSSRHRRLSSRSGSDGSALH
jgi:hypothetical protein